MTVQSAPSKARENAQPVASPENLYLVECAGKRVGDDKRGKECKWWKARENGVSQSYFVLHLIGWEKKAIIILCINNGLP